MTLRMIGPVNPRRPDPRRHPARVMKLILIGLLVASAAPVVQAFEDGTYLVGVDVKPGIYRASGGSSCVWKRLKGLGGELGDVLGMDAGVTKPMVEIKATDRAFHTERCGTWSLVQGAGEVTFAVAPTAITEGDLKRLADTLPEEILRQTFHIRTPVGIGTAFTVEMDERQYLVTAQHVIGDASPLMVEIQVGETAWRRLPVTVIGMERAPVDVAVLATDTMLGERSGVPVGVGTVGYGQEVRFLGYALGLALEPIPDFREAPLPLVKAGILSSIKRNDKGFWHLLVDATGNKGFSGGPLVLPRQDGDGGIDWHIAGVVTDAIYERSAVRDESGAVVGRSSMNAGILVAISIDAVTRMIRENPEGYAFSD